MRCFPLLAFCAFACDPVPVDSGSGTPPADTAVSAADTALDTGDSAEGEDTGTTFLPGDLHLGIPAYAYPGTEAWAGFVQGAAATGGFIVINPRSGPGSVIDDAYTVAVAEAQAQGVIVLGYVPTEYGLREGSAVDGDVNQYVFWYGVDGVLFDEVAEDCTTFAPWYAERAAAADALDPDGHAFVALNPGLLTCSDYLGAADVLVVGEDELARLRDFTPAEWMADFDPSRFWLLAHDAGPMVLGETLAAAREDGIGWIYLTDDRLPNPWDATPSYWADEVAALAAD